MIAPVRDRSATTCRASSRPASAVVAGRPGNAVVIWLRCSAPGRSPRAAPQPSIPVATVRRNRCEETCPTRPATRPRHRHRDRLAASARVGGRNAHEHAAPLRGRWTAVRAGSDDGLADIGRARKPITPSTLAADDDLSAAVDIASCSAATSPTRSPSRPSSFKIANPAARSPSPGRSYPAAAEAPQARVPSAVRAAASEPPTAPPRLSEPSTVPSTCRNLKNERSAHTSPFA